MKNNLSLLVFFLSVSSFLSAQNMYKPGLIVKNSGDTLKGWVGYDHWQHNPSKIRFKTDQSAASSAWYTVNDLDYFGITGLDAYKKAIVSKDMRSVEMSGITPSTPDSFYCEKLLISRGFK